MILFVTKDARSLDLIDLEITIALEAEAIVLVMTDLEAETTDEMLEMYAMSGMIVNVTITAENGRHLTRNKIATTSDLQCTLTSSLIPFSHPALSLSLPQEELSPCAQSRSLRTAMLKRLLVPLPIRPEMEMHPSCSRPAPLVLTRPSRPSQLPEAISQKITWTCVFNLK